MDIIREQDGNADDNHNERRDMTIRIYKSKTTGERFALEECEGGYIQTPPLTPEQLASILGDIDHASIDGDLIDSVPEDLQQV